jgi:hypothetical protein
MQQALSLQDSLVVPPDVLFRYVEDETVLLNSDTGTYFGLDAVGTRLWQLIVEHGSLRQVYDAALQEYAVEPIELEHDLLALAQQLRDRGLTQVERMPPATATQ